jgi:hypothetical protein
MASAEDRTSAVEKAPTGDEASQRLAWIRRNFGYVPQPYEQLVGWYPKIDQTREARRVLLEKQRHRRRTLSDACGVICWMPPFEVGPPPPARRAHRLRPPLRALMKTWTKMRLLKRA